MKKDHLEVLLEDINSKLDGISEGMRVLPTRDEFNDLTAKVDRIGTDVEVIKAAVKDQSRVLHAHGDDIDDARGRIQRLEHHAA